jgi:cell wall-associated NlpC family hydrolase
VELRGLIGRPYAGRFGCAELVREIMQQRGLDLPDFREMVSDGEKAEALVRHLREYADPVDRPEPGDVVLLAWAGHPAHLGVIAEPGVMIHSLETIGAHLERIDRGRWRRRVLGYWRPRGV